MGSNPSRCRILDGHFLTYLFVVKKNCNVCLKINEKEAMFGPFFKNEVFLLAKCKTCFDEDSQTFIIYYSKQP